MKSTENNNNNNSAVIPIQQAQTFHSSYSINQDKLQRENQVGYGGYGTIYRGMYYKSPVAIKELNIAQRNSNAKLQFEREARILAKLKHPHIITCFGYSIDANPPFIVMQLMDKR